MSALPRLHAILDVETAERAQWNPVALLDAFLAGGARLIQIRAKALASGPFLELCDAAVRRALPCGARIIVNDRVDLALASGAAGVHVGQDDLPPAAARRLLGPAALIGWSTHEAAQVTCALEAPISYLAVGPIFGTRTKDTGYDAVGLGAIAAAVRRAGDLPVVAIGGITLEGAPAVIEAGAASVAVIGDLVAHGDPAARVAAYVRLLDAIERV